MEAEAHDQLVDRLGWLRAAVLGANDGVLSTGALLIGIAATAASHKQLLVTGLAGLVAGAMSMAAGEYVSVSSQKDAEAVLAAEDRDQLAGEVIANPIKAAIASALSFSAGALLPILAVVLEPHAVMAAVGIAVLFGLMLLGWAGATLGAASRTKAVVRAICWGVLAMLVTVVAQLGFGAG